MYCLKKFFLGISYYFLANINAVAAGSAEVQRQIQAIPLNPSFVNVVSGIDTTLPLCLESIAHLPVFHRDALLDELERRVNSIAPTYAGLASFRSTLGPSAFSSLRSSILTRIQTARDATTRELAQARSQVLPIQEVDTVESHAVTATSGSAYGSTTSSLATSPVLQPHVRHEPSLVSPDAVNTSAVLSAEEQEIVKIFDTIDKHPEINSNIRLAAHMRAIHGNINGPIMLCIAKIEDLPAGRREFLLIQLEKEVSEIAPTFANEQLKDDFRARIADIKKIIKKAIAEAKKPPVDERLDPTPVVVSLATVDTADALTPQQIRHYPDVNHQLAGTELDGLPAAFEDNTKAVFEARLITYALGHMTAYYKTTSAVWDTTPIKVKLRDLFIQIDLLNMPRREIPESENWIHVNRRKDKVDFIERTLHSLYANKSKPVPTSVDDVLAIMEDLEENHVFTRMEAIKALPSVDWTKVVEKYVFDVNGDLKQKDREGEDAYWRRIGDYVIGVYRNKIKPHINPDGLLREFTINKDVPLVPLSLMFPGAYVKRRSDHTIEESDLADASTVFEGLTRAAITRERQAGDLGFGVNHDPIVLVAAVELAPAVPMDLRNNIFDFEVSSDNLRTKDDRFKRNLAQVYQRVDDYMIQALVKLFGTRDQIREGLSWVWGWHDFPAERLELCRKVLLTFHYFNRDGDNYDEDIPDIAAFAGRATHCSDGKKTGIEATSSRVLCVLSGKEDDIVIEDFDAFLRKAAFHGFKVRTINSLAMHDHRENVSMNAMIRSRNKEFWEVPTDITANLSPYSYKESDYGLDTKDDFATPNTDKVLQHFYHHVYAGPHELVNVIYMHLGSMDAHQRKGFFGFACTMLGARRPFEDMTAAAYNYGPLVKARYCECVIDGKQDPKHRVAPEDDYTFTRKGIEILLFYSGYLAWNGHKKDHPIEVDWKDNLDWLRAKDPDTYKAIYKEPDETSIST